MSAPVVLTASCARAGHVLDAAGPWEAVLGVPIDQVVGRPLSLRVHRGDRSLLEHAVGIAEPRPLAARLETAEGIPIPALARVSAEDDDLRRVSLELRATEVDLLRALGAARHRMQALVERTDDAIFIKDLQLRYRFINAAGARLIDRVPSDVVGRRDSELFAATTADEIIEVDRRVIETGQPVTYRPERQDFGNRRVFLTTKYPYFDPDGRPAGLVGVSRDVTAWVEAQESRRALEQSLAHTDRLATVGALAAGVAHEANNPLAWMTHQLEQSIEALERGGPVDRAALADRLRQTLDGAERIQGIVGELRGLTRAESDPAAPTDMATVLAGAARFASVRLRTRVTLVQDFAPVPLVQANASRLGQVFLNLLVNAAEALEGNTPETARVTLIVRRVDDEVHATVQDTGRGIAPGDVARVLDQGFTTKADGSGLGLWLSNGFLKDMGGRLVVQAPPEGGAAFTVVLPVAAEARAPASTAPAAPSPPAPSPGPALRIAVVEDEPILRELIAEVFKPLATVETFPDGLAAWEALEHAEVLPDVVVTDVVMPRMDGIALHARMAARRPALAERMFFLTGGAMDVGVRRFLEAHADRVMHKPFRVAALRAAVLALANG